MKKFNLFTIIEMVDKPKIAYILSGQGSDDMGKQLFDQSEVFVDTMIRLHNYLLNLSSGEIKLLELFVDGDQWTNKKYYCIGIVSVQIGLLNMLEREGYTPDYIIGYSIGEIASSYADGCLSEEQCMQIALIHGEFAEIDGADYNSILLDKLTRVIPYPKTRSAKCLTTSDTNPLCDALYHATNMIEPMNLHQLLPKNEQICCFEISPNEGLLGQISLTPSDN
jgi:hypothetical protein